MATRTQIRDAIKAVAESIDGITTVYVGRRRAIPESKLPAACVYVEREIKELDRLGSDENARRLEIITEIHLQANTAEAVEEELDTLCAARETAMLADAALDALIFDITFVEDEYQAVEDVRRPAGVALCRDALTYYG